MDARSCLADTDANGIHNETNMSPIPFAEVGGGGGGGGGGHTHH